MPKPLKTFIIYAREDAVFKNELLRQLAPFVQMGLLEKWDDSHILPGEEWEKSIEKALKASQIVLMLVSANSLFSEFIQRKELKTALEQKREGTTRVIPILVSDCMYDMAKGISNLQMLPLHPVSRSLTPVDNLAIWGSRASAWAAALRQLRELVHEVHAKIEAEEKIQREQAEKLAELAALAAEAQRVKELEAERAKAIEEKERSQREKDAQARAKLLHNKDEAAWRAVLEIDTLEAYEDYAEKYTLHEAEVLERIGMLEAQEARRRAERKRIIKSEGQNLGLFEARKGTSGSAIQIPAIKLDPFQDLMILIKGGNFDMGDIFGDGETSEKPVHKVTLGDFQLCKYPVTQAQWKGIMGENPSFFKGDELPVEQVSWHEAKDFIKKINEKTGQKYRLPTEAEWEYAAREGGKKVRFGNGKDIADPREMNFDATKDYKKPYSVDGEYREKTTQVSQFKPNALGLHDMSGNVWEWCQDVLHDNYKDSPDDGSAWEQGGYSSRRVLRGGSWYSNPEDCRATIRLGDNPVHRHSAVGFRVVLDY